MGLTPSLYINYCQAHVWKLEQDLEKMTNIEDMEILVDKISLLKDGIENSPSWKELTSVAEYQDVVETLAEELKQLRATYLAECKTLLKKKDK